MACFCKLWRADAWAFVGGAALLVACAAPPEEGVVAADSGTLEDAVAADVSTKDVPLVAVDAAPPVEILGDVGHADAGGRTSAGQCTTTADCALFDDGDACNGTFFCDLSAATSVCRVNPATVIKCDVSADTPCSHTKCEPTTGQCMAVNSVNGTPCVDDDPCSVDSACGGGVCKAKGVASWCDCKNGEDCAVFEDGNACNGTLICDLEHFPHKCVINPTTVVQCSSSGDTQCTKNQCDPNSGKCAVTPVQDGAPCDDGDKGTYGDACKAGKCGAGNKVACSSDQDCDALEDGDLCNGTLFCDLVGKSCQLNPVTVISCPTGKNTACEKNICNPVTGQCAMQPVKNGAPCDDLETCTGGDVCLGGKCSGGKNICTCATDADCAGKDDGNKCNGLPFCNLATKACEVAPNSVVICPTANDTACVKSACVPLTKQCTPTAIELTELLPCPQPGGAETPACRREVRANPTKGPACDDGDPCTVGEVCSQGECSGTFVCKCQSDADCAKDEDGDQCNGTLFCNKSSGKCALTQPTVCPVVTGVPCRANQCQPKTSGSRRPGLSGTRSSWALTFADARAGDMSMVTAVVPIGMPLDSFARQTTDTPGSAARKAPRTGGGACGSLKWGRSARRTGSASTIRPTSVTSSRRDREPI